MSQFKKNFVSIYLIKFNASSSEFKKPPICKKVSEHIVPGELKIGVLKTGVDGTAPIAPHP